MLIDHDPNNFINFVAITILIFTYRILSRYKLVLL